MTRAEPAETVDLPAAAKHYGTIVIIGGGCYGSYYVRQLGRARARQALDFDRLVVVDRDEACAVARERPRELELVVSDWSDYLASYLGSGSLDADAIVPSPLMPHLLFQWLERCARARWPGRRVAAELPDAVPGVPWQRPGGDSTRYVSFAEWMCPVNCIEPRVCPHTRERRSWSLPPSVAAHVDAARAAGERLHGPAIFHCTHRAYGVGMIDVRDVLAAERMLVEAAGHGEVRLLVGTVSHCHGALGVLAVGEPL